jgi:Peptidase family M23
MIVVIILGILTIAIPCFAVTILFMRVHTSLTDWLFSSVIASLMVSAVYLIGTWAYLSYYLRYLALLLLIFSLVLSYYRLRRNKPKNPEQKTKRLVFRIFSLLTLLSLNIWIITGRMTFRKPIELEFPLKEGTYYILQGGNGGINNFFHSFKPDLRYALDIVKLNSFGNRACGLCPGELNDYCIYKVPVYSPSAGEITEALDTVEDNAPGKGGDINSKANHINIRAGQYEIHLDHLLKNSIKVKLGDYVDKGQLLARVGNSGFTNEPHLHIHVTSTGESKEVFPMSFRGRFLSVNSIFKN